MRDATKRGFTGLLGELGRSEVGRATFTGFLVAWALGQLVGGFVVWLIMAAAGDRQKLDEALLVVLAFAAGLAALVVSLVAAWIGGRVARRMTIEPELLPRVARAYAWTLGVVGALEVLLVGSQLMRLEFLRTRAAGGAHFGFARATGPDQYVLLVMLMLVAIAAPFAGRAGVLPTRAGRGDPPRRASNWTRHSA